MPYDPASDSPVISSSPLREFVLGQAPGSAIDFATAAAMMARAAGIQSRIAAGYLPGHFNSYSGASAVRESDAHAWAEVYFEKAGWVPLDASSRPDLPTIANIETPPDGGLSRLLARRVGDEFADALKSAPDGLQRGFQAVMDNIRAAGIVLSILSALPVLWLLRRLRLRARKRGHTHVYERLEGSRRQAMLALFRSAVRALVNHGRPRRGPAESFLQYAEALGRDPAPIGGDIRWLAEEASRAAFSEAPVDVPATAEAQRRLKRLKGALAAPPPGGRA
jgi:hypothetical protein